MNRALLLEHATLLDNTLGNQVLPALNTTPAAATAASPSLLGVPVVLSKDKKEL
ncbi:hypothetical protein CLV59_108345 [Chitinophaga dinghuensis]|uniref:Uncharacterized protein n=1 Tax=Chitinophaga dinghuensis TaxID=1539050 RepID=A0A327VQV5_9BACT|nr:hypothetical protein CLV59_108345 [Chitinophaga dinghuensis]